MCEYCGHPEETVQHFLIDCPGHARERQPLRNKFPREASSMAFLLSHKHAREPLLRYIRDTGRFREQLR